MATTNISQQLATGGAWTLVATAPVTNILLVGAPGSYTVRVATSLPAADATGTPASPTEGSWGSNVLATDENVYAKPFGAYEGVAITLSGQYN